MCPNRKTNSVNLNDGESRPAASEAKGYDWLWLFSAEEPKWIPASAGTTEPGIPAKAGIQVCSNMKMDSRMRGNDD